MKKILISVCTMLLMLGGLCGRAELHQDFLCHDEKYLADYNALWEMLDSCYPHWGAIERMGIDKEKVKESGREKLIGSIAAGEGLRGLYRIIQQVCRDFRNFAHLEAISWYRYDSMYEGLLQDREWYQDKIAVFEEPKTIESYHYLRGADTHKTMHSAATGPFTSVLTRLYDRERIAYIRINSFHDRSVQIDKEKIYGFWEKTKDYHHVIIDITDNPGGSTLYWRDNIAAPLGGEYGFVNYLFYTSQARDRLALSIPHHVFKRMSLLPDHIFFKYDEDKDNLDFFVEVTRNFDFGSPEIEHRAKRWLLVNGNVYSAAEQFTEFCSKTGWATVVGTQTGGDGITIGGPAPAALPETGLLIRFSAEYSLNPDGSSNAEDGTNPDFYCEPWETPMMTCLRLLETEGADTAALKKDPMLRH